MMNNINFNFNYIVCLLLFVFLNTFISCSSCSTNDEDESCVTDGSEEYIRFRYEDNITYIRNYHETRPISVKFQTVCLPVPAGWRTIVVEPNSKKLAYKKYDDYCSSGRGHVKESVCSNFDL